MVQSSLRQHLCFGLCKGDAMEAVKVGGSLRKNLKKEKDSQPDLVGKWTDSDGTQYWLSAWRNHDEKTGNV